jgi:hypothetical protein
MEKICLIYQPAGLGDIFYTIGIARHYQKLGYRIIWPVVKEIISTLSYIPGIEFYDWEGEFPMKKYYNNNSLDTIITEEFIFLPIHKSTDILGGLVMPSKYNLASLNPEIWKDNFIWTRNLEKEKELYYNVLCLSKDEPFILVNQNFVTPPRTLKFPIDLDTKHKIISMDYIEGFNVLDWALVLEKASGIVTIDTCIQYMIENLNCEAEFYYCYLRNGINTYYQIKDLFNTPWTFLDKDNNLIQ